MARRRCWLVVVVVFLAPAGGARFAPNASWALGGYRYKTRERLSLSAEFNEDRDWGVTSFDSFPRAMLTVFQVRCGGGGEAARNDALS